MTSRRGRPPATTLPYEKVTLLGLILSANNTSIWMIFSFLPFMVQYFFPELTKAELGYFAGILGSAFSAGSLIGNIIWGVVSDRYGRRPALLLGLTGTAICSLAFGFSPTFWFAVSFRFLWGLLNGNVGVAKTYLAEISDDTNSAKGMALFGVIGGLGRTIGPVIGGFLSSPADLYPQVFAHTIFETYPYALPSLVISVNCSIVLLISFLYLSETVAFSKRQTAVGQGATIQPGYSLLTSSEDPDEADLDVLSRSLSKREPSNGIELQSLSSTVSPLSSSITTTAAPTKPFSRETRPAPRTNNIEEEKKTLIQESHFLDSVNEEEEEEEEEYGGGGGNDDVEEGLLRKEKRRDSSRSKPQAIGTLVISRNSPDVEGLSSSQKLRKQQRNRLTFNGVVQIKEIGSGKLRYSSLKVDQDETPIIDFREEQEKKADPLRSTHISGDEEEGEGRFSSSSSEEESGQPQSQKRTKKASHDERELSVSFHQKKIRFSNGSEDFFDENNRLTLPTSRSVVAKIAYLLKRREIFISTLLYGTNALTMIATNEIFPLWVVTPRDLGGFSFTSDKIGLSTMICGVFAILMQITLYPKLVECFGTMGTYKISTLLYAAGAFLAPMISMLNTVPVAAVQWIGIVTAQILLTVPASFVLVTVFVFINNSCYSQHRATVNGIGQTFASLGRLVGPYCAARLFAWSETNRSPWPFNYYFTFYLVGLITLFNWYLSIFLPRSIERRRREPAVDFMKQPLVVSATSPSASTATAVIPPSSSSQ